MPRLSIIVTNKRCTRWHHSTMNQYCFLMCDVLTLQKRNVDCVIAHQQDQADIKSHLIPSFPQPRCLKTFCRRKAFHTTPGCFFDVGLCQGGRFIRKKIRSSLMYLQKTRTGKKSEVNLCSSKMAKLLGLFLSS